MLRYLDDDKSWIDVTDKNDIEVMVAHCEKKISQNVKYQIRVFVNEDLESASEFIDEYSIDSTGDKLSNHSNCGSLGGKFSLVNGHNVKYRQEPKLQRDFLYIDEVKV